MRSTVSPRSYLLPGNSPYPSSPPFPLHEFIGVPNECIMAQKKWVRNLSPLSGSVYWGEERLHTSIKWMDVSYILYTLLVRRF